MGENWVIFALLLHRCACLKLLLWITETSKFASLLSFIFQSHGNKQLKIAQACGWKVSNCFRLSLEGNEHNETMFEIKSLDNSYVLNTFWKVCLQCSLLKPVRILQKSLLNLCGTLLGWLSLYFVFVSLLNFSALSVRDVTPSFADCAM